MDLPHLPEDEAGFPDRTPMSLRTKVVIVVIALALAVIAVLHLTGVVGEQ